MRGIVARSTAAAVVVLVVGIPSGAAVAAPVAPAQKSAGHPAPGAPGIGDRLFPTLGNGGYDVRSYDLHLTYPTKDPAQTVVGDVTITAVATQALSRFDLDFAGRSVGSVSVDGRAASFARSGSELVVTPARALAKGRRFTVVVRRFTARPQAPDPDAAPAGFFFSKTGTVVAAQPDAAQQLFPVNDHPRDKATYRFVVDAPAGWTAATNGVLVSRRAKAGRVLWTFREPDPLASELVQVAVGDFAVVRRPSVGGVPIRDVVPRTQVARLTPMLDVERSQLAWMTARVGRFPNVAYGSLVFDAAIGYSLETQTLSLFDAPIVAADTAVGYRNGTMLHELAHEWFGDSVSPYAWSDIWLNEGHATWYEAQYDATHGYVKDDLGYPDLESYFRAVYRKGDQVRNTYGPVARPRSGSVDDLFNPNVYDGGALALYALRQKVGAKAFAAIEHAWVTRYRGRSVSTDDFIALASRVAHRDLRTFLIAWLYGTRTPPMPGHPDWTVDPVPATSASGAAGSSTQNSLPSGSASTTQRFSSSR
jgi:aminopeptidase N